MSELSFDFQVLAALMGDAAETRARHEANQTFLGDVVGFVVPKPRNFPLCRPCAYGLFRVTGQLHDIFIVRRSGYGVQTSSSSFQYN